MNLRLTREQRIAHRVLLSFHERSERLESYLTGLEQAETAQFKITASLSEMTLSGANKDKMLANQIKIDNAINQIALHAENFADDFEKVEELITDVQEIDENAGRVLRLTYIERMPASNIAEICETSNKTIYERLRKGLNLAYMLLTA